MKRMIISAVLIVCVMTGSLLALMYTKHTTVKMHELERDIRRALDNNESGFCETERFCDHWESCCDVLSLIEDLDDIEVIDQSISRLRALTENDPETAAAELDSICRQLDMLYRHQLPDIYSVL